MFPADRIAASSMQMARRMVGRNELLMARDEAMRVFTRHGGRFDQDRAPVTGPCQQDGNVPCDEQRLAFSVLLSLSTFETAQELIVDAVIAKLEQRLREGHA